MTSNAKDTPCETLQCDEEDDEDDEIQVDDLKNEETAAFEEQIENDNNVDETINKRQSLPYFISESNNSSCIDERQMESDILLKSENLYRSPFQEDQRDECAPPVKAVHRRKISDDKSSVFVSFKKQSGGTRAQKRSPEKPAKK